jgi:glycosyltransferase involved in cell wall biosynthesis
MGSALQRARRAISKVAPARHRDTLLFVVDDAGWIVDEIAKQLQSHLPAGVKSAIVSHGWEGARGCTVHFINRIWAWNDTVLDRVHPSNRLVGVWWHGRFDAEDQATRQALARLRASHQRFARFQVTCTSARQTLEAAGVSSDRIVTLPIGVDLRMFRPPADLAARRAARRALGIPDSAHVVGCFQKDSSGWDDAGEPKMIKGPDVLVDALARLHARHPIHAVIPGPARGFVKRGLASAGVPFSAPGHVSRGELPSLYHSLDMYMSPSRDEGGPAGALEAMASGVALVSTSAGIPADMIDSGRNGVLVPTSDAAALADAAEGLIVDRGRREALAGAALDTIRAYDWPVLVERYVTELYGPLRPAGA